MSINNSIPTRSSRASLVVIALIASLLVLVSPVSQSKADYLTFTNYTTDAEITYNDRVCNLGDPSTHLTAETAFEISTADQLWEVTDCVSNSAVVHFKITANIDASAASYSPTSSPIGFSSSSIAAFTGVLDGGGFAVSVSMTTNAGVGLFSYLHDATFSNLIIRGNFVTTTTTFDGVNFADHAAGGLAVKTGGLVSLISLANLATVSGRQNVGGLVGYAGGDLGIISSDNSAAIVGSRAHIGGLLGRANSSATINGSANSGRISSTAGAGTGNAGGLAGWVAGDVAIHNSVNTGQVQTKGLYVGGILGRAESNAHFTHVTNSGTISAKGRDYVGGVVGYVQGTVTVSESVNQAQVNGAQETGGIVGYAGGLASLTSVRNLSHVSGTNEVGGLVGYVVLEAKIISSFNNGSISGTNQVGGLLGRAFSASEISASHNTGNIAGTVDVGGLLGFGDDIANINSSFNTGSVSGTTQVGGLAGRVNFDANINSSFNTGPISGSIRAVGGLVGVAGANIGIESSYNTGTVFGAVEQVGGLMGVAHGNVVITTSYNTGAVTGTTDVDGIAGIVTGTVTTTSAYSSVASDFVATSTTAEMQLASTYVGFDFSSANPVWGFGTCSENNGFPMMRVFGGVTTYYSTGCFTAPQAPASTPTPTPTPAPVYSGPIISGAPSAVAGTEVTLTGNRLESVTTAYVGGAQVRIVSSLAQSLTLDIPSSMFPGSYDLVLQSSFGTLTILNGLTVLASLDTGSVVEATNKKLTVVALKGFIAIYTRGYEGQRLSAKVAGKWLVVESLDESFKGNDHSRTVRQTGSGFSIKVHLYIDREFVRVEDLITQ